jgi:hypothetical protein
MVWLPKDLQARLQRIEEYCGLIQSELLAIREKKLADSGPVVCLRCTLCVDGERASLESPCPVCGRTGTEKRRGD